MSIAAKCPKCNMVGYCVCKNPNKIIFDFNLPNSSFRRKYKQELEYKEYVNFCKEKKKEPLGRWDLANILDGSGDPSDITKNWYAHWEYLKNEPKLTWNKILAKYINSDVENTTFAQWLAQNFEPPKSIKND